jgi:hypothetical protein
MDGGAREASAERGAYHVRPAEFERRDYEPDSARARAREAFVPREPRHAQPRRPLAAGAATRLNLAVDL